MASESEGLEVVAYRWRDEGQGREWRATTDVDAPAIWSETVPGRETEPLVCQSDHLAAVERAREEGRWRDSKEEPPPLGRRILVSEGGRATVARGYKDGRWLRGGSKLLRRPRYWTPLPTPPPEREGGVG